MARGCKPWLLFEAVTNDEYEIPCFLGTAKEMAEFLGIRLDSFRNGLSRGYKTQRGYKIYRFNKEDIEE